MHIFGAVGILAAKYHCYGGTALLFLVVFGTADLVIKHVQLHFLICVFPMG